jgi:predicted transcriptional regulator YdeE
MIKINLPAFQLIGITLGYKTTNENGQSAIDCGNLWQKFEKEGYIDSIPDRLSDEIFAVYYDYDGDYRKPYSYFIGCKVKNVIQLPQGMTNLNIPEQNYNKVVAKGQIPDSIANAWQTIWNPQTARAYKFDFELYDERSKDWKNAEVDIFLSV